jgi:hypothetical protein
MVKRMMNVLCGKLLRMDLFLVDDNDPLQYTSNITYLYSFFHVLSGHANILDTYFSNPLATYYDTIARVKIVFHDEEDKDPDWKVRRCYLLLIGAATVPFTGVENLWKTGRFKGCHNYPDFGKYMPINFFALLHPMHGLILSIDT